MPKKKESIGVSYDIARKQDKIKSLIKPSLWENGYGKFGDIWYLFGWQLWFDDSGWWKLFCSHAWGHFQHIRIIEGKKNLEKAKKLSYEHIIRQKQKDIIDIHRDIMKIIVEG